MEFKPIKSKRDYETALKRIEGLMNAKRNSPEGDELDILVTLVEAYEARHFPLDLFDPRLRRQVNARGKLKELPLSARTGGLRKDIDGTSNRSLFDAAEA